VETIFSDAANGAKRCCAARILIADDTASGRELLRFILEDLGHEVVEAENGEQVIVKASLAAPHLMILDLQMPKLDGWATAATLRRIPEFKRIPIVALTAGWSELMPERIVEAGFTAYLVKPIAPSRLRECVASLLAG
jgi:CheY-like chemotaxis protein